jgi:hypothetical protein
MKVTFELEIHRALNGRDEFPISVQITDHTSSCRILQMDLGVEQFGEILFGRSGLRAEGELWLDNPIGCAPQHKNEAVPRPRKYPPIKQEEDKILAPFEIDGWRGNRSDLHNHHRWVDDKLVSVSFARFINPDGSVWQRK